jgi:hypothetical protein
MTVRVFVAALLAVLTLASSAWADCAWTERRVMIDSNALYYTFSTIAQTLAAAFGVLTAIVVVRLPGFEHAVDHARSVLLLQFGPNAEAAWDHLRDGGVRALRNAGFDPALNDVNVGPHLISGHRAWVAWGRLIPAVWIALVPTGVDIAACLIALPQVPKLM